MKIGIIGATGKLGNLLVRKLTDKGEIPTAIIRNQSKMTVNIPTIEKDIFNLTADEVKGFDVLVNTFNAPLDDPNQFITSTEHLIDILKETGTRLVFAGGAGVLLVAENTMLVDTPEIPAAFKIIFSIITTTPFRVLVIMYSPFIRKILFIVFGIFRMSC